MTAPDPFPKFEPAPEDAGAEDTAEQPARKPSSDDLVASDQVLANPASLWRRALSWVFDFSVIAGTVSGLVSLALAVMKARPIPNNVHGIDVFLFRLHPIAIPALVLTVLVAGLYTALGAFLLEGRTLGRLMLGIRLVDSSGRAPSRIRSALRAAFAIVSFALFLAGFWLALFDRRGQTLHDKLTRTFVVRPV